jgi:hypothetical protein
MRNTITVEWPALPIGEPGWRTRLECLATRAEALVGRKCSLQQTAEMALELFGLVWPAFGPETVAASARAAALLGLPVVMSSAPAEQCREIAERLEDIWQAAQDDPSVCVVEVGPPLLQQVKPAAVEPPAVIKVIEALVEPEPEPEPVNTPSAQGCAVGDLQDDELPEAWQIEPEPIEPAVVWLRSDDLAAALGVSQTTVLVWNRRGLFDGLSRKPRPGEGWGRRFDLEQCRAAYEARPGPRRSKATAPAPLPVVLTDLPPAVEPSAPEPTPEAAADAAALLELAGGDEATLAALRALLLVA